MRFDTWAQRGLAAVDGTAAQQDYAAWLETYLANWRAYVADTCPHVRAEVRDKLVAHLTARAAYWTDEARPPRQFSPRRTSSGRTSGSAPLKSRNSAIASTLPPFDNSVRRK